MRIYYIDFGPIHFFKTLEEAKRAARIAADDNNEAVTVERCEVKTDQASIVALANGITARGEEICVIKPKRRN
jgi:hypothetical protein